MTREADAIAALMDLGDDVVKQAKNAGADVAETCVQQGSHLSTKVRMHEPELVEEAGSRALGLRVMLGNQVAVTYTSDLSDAGRTRLVEDAIELARLSETDPFAGPPDPSLLSNASDWVDLDPYDSSVERVTAEEALNHALVGEKASFETDSRITNSEGATFTRAAGSSVIVTSGGFRGGEYGTSASLVVNPVADDADGKKRSGYYWSASRHLAELDPDVEVGAEAARRTVAQLGAQKLPSQELAIIFDKDAARSILGLLAGCILGGSIWRRSSYLLDRVGTRIASDLVTVVDDPLIPRAPGSRPFDGEGLLSRANLVVDQGILKTYLTDTYSARKLDVESTANAARSSSGGVGPSTTNFILKPGDLEREQLIADTDHGLYVTQMMGFGFNGVTGDFSRGASGFHIRAGELAEPVSEVTISLNLDQLLQRIDAVANDLDHRTSTTSPTFRVNAMTLAGT